MNAVIGFLNTWGDQAVAFAWPMLWQSSVLILALLILDHLFRGKVRASVRYALWALVLVKLVLPPSLALPTGPAWWVPAGKQGPQKRVIITEGPVIVSPAPAPTLVASYETLQPKLTWRGVALACTGAVSLALLICMTVRLVQFRREACASTAPPESLLKLLRELCELQGVRHPIRLRLVRGSLGPALFGLIRPTILLPEMLLSRLSSEQLRSVLLHELMHWRRRDIWVSCAQALLQVVYWWHPLIWVANHRMRAVREEAVDDAVMVALRESAGSYAPTLLEVARVVWPRRLASIGLLGIVEGRGSLTRRIERLLDFRPPRTAGLTLGSALAVVAFGAMALPMAQPEPATAPEPPTTANQTSEIGAEETAPEARRHESSALAQDGKLLFEMGKLDEAEKKLKEAIAQDARNQAAYYYLNLIQEQRHRSQVARGSGDVTNTATGRVRIVSKLDRIRLDTVLFKDIPLADVVQTLNREAKRLDPEGRGINFIINQTGQGLGSNTQDVATVKIKLAEPLSDMRLADVLDAVVKTAQRPIKYSIEPYGVVFSYRQQEAAALYTRMIKVDPNQFAAQLSPNGASGFAAADWQKALREYFEKLQVDLTPPKSIFYNDQEGTLLVRATLRDLDIIESGLRALTLAPAQINIRATFIELSESEASDFWAKHAPGQNPGQLTWSAQMEAADAKAQLEAWKGAGGNVLAQPSVTTLSGRQAEVQMGGPQTVVTYANNAWATNNMMVGLSLRVFPVAADPMIQLAVIASSAEFLGYNEEPGSKFPVPKFQRHEWVSPTEFVSDGRTLALGGDPKRQPPARAGEVHKQLIILVTPTLIDSAGNRLHSDGSPRGEKMNALEGPVRAWHPTIPPRPVK